MSLLIKACEMPMGQERHDALQKIEAVRVQIAAMRRIDSRIAEVGAKRTPS